MTLGELLSEARNQLSQSPTPQLDAELIIQFALGVERIEFYRNPERPLTSGDIKRCQALFERRSRGEPVAYLLGEKEFFGRVFKVGPGVLIPRPETEHVVEEVLSRIEENAKLQIADFGCGSGCIGLTLLCEIPQSRLLAVDLASEAIEFTSRNAELLGVAERLQVEQIKVEELQNEILFDVIVANPPYISTGDPWLDTYVKAFEPHLALFAENEGLECLRQWSAKALKLLKPGGLLVMEMGAQQMPEVKKILREHGSYRDIRERKDYAGWDRVISARKLGGNDNG